MNHKLSYPLTIITINYNNSEGLKCTVNSVLNQSFTDFEYVVIDGASKDDSVEFLQSIKSKNFEYISEPDTGIYNAMNKGIERAKGKYLLFLNSGDYLENENVLDIIQLFFNNDYGVLAGNIIFDEDQGKRLREHPEKMTFSYL